MNLLADIITYVRRILKTPSNVVITDSLIVDYINRFWIMDVDARIQLFDLKTKYQFQTSPGYDQYNIPLYGVQVSPTIPPQVPIQLPISYLPVYQGFFDPVLINGIPVTFQTQKTLFFNMWPNIVQQMNIVLTGDGGPTYTFRFPIAPNNSTPITTPFQYILRGHVDIQGIIAIINTGILSPNYQDPPIVDSLQSTTVIPAIPPANVFPAVYITSNGADGSNVVVCDSGTFLTGDQNFGLLMTQGTQGQPNAVLAGGYSPTINTINYFTGQVNVTFPDNIPVGVNINAQCFLFQSGLPRGVLFWNNTIILRSPPDQQYLVELDAYLTPAGFLATGQSIQFAYMCEYLARGAARKILADTGDIEQFNFYEPLFKEQELLVWKRSQRQFTATRTPTIYSQGPFQGLSGFNNLGGSSL